MFLTPVINGKQERCDNVLVFSDYMFPQFTKKEMKIMKHKKIDLQCNNISCKKKFNFAEELEIGNVTIEAEGLAVFWCPCCGNQTFLLRLGAKSKKIDY